MRKLILQEFVTLDGMAADHNGGVEFVPASTRGDQSFAAEQLAFLDSIDVILLGKVTYQMFAGYWPHVTDPNEKPFADKLNRTAKIVFSHTLQRAPWGAWPEAAVVHNSATEEVPELKRKSGKDMIIWGSISLAQSLMRAGLVDEYRLVVCPLVLPAGRPLFTESAAPARLQLASAKPLDRGAVSLKYGV